MIQVKRIMPPAIYRALLVQSGASSPIATVLQNTIGEIVWTRIDAGNYSGTLANAFNPQKTMVSISTVSDFGEQIFLRMQFAEVGSVDFVRIIALNLDLESPSLLNAISAQDNFRCNIEILVYP